MEKVKAVKAEVLDVQTVEKVMEPFERDKKKIEREAEKLQVTSQEGMLEADDFIANAKRGISAIREEKKKRLSPLKDHIEWLSGIFDTCIEAFQNAVEIAEKKRATFREKEAERIAKINAERAEKEAAERRRVEAEAEKQRIKAQKEYEAEKKKREEALAKAKAAEEKARAEARKLAEKKNADEAEIKKQKEKLEKIKKQREEEAKQAERDRIQHKKEMEEMEKEKKAKLEKVEDKHAPKEQATTVGTTSFAKKWDAEVEDKSEYLLFLSKADIDTVEQAVEFKLAPLRSIAVKTDGKAKVPGVRFFQKEVPMTKINDFVGGK